jgi:hypothetical protein
VESDVDFVEDENPYGYRQDNNRDGNGNAFQRQHTTSAEPVDLTQLPVAISASALACVGHAIAFPGFPHVASDAFDLAHSPGQQ